MGDTGYFYVPRSCNTNQCGLHVVFHGCNQDLETLGETFIHKTRLNEYADTNDFVVLYPQVRSA